MLPKLFKRGFRNTKSYSTKPPRHEEEFARNIALFNKIAIDYSKGTYLGILNGELVTMHPYSWKVVSDALRESMRLILIPLAILHSRILSNVSEC
jgi:hypothetical protein